MIGIARLGTNDLERAKGFYDEIFSMVGIASMRVSDTACVWGKPGAPVFVVGKPFDGESAVTGNGAMFGFPLASRAMVDAVHARVIALGGKDEGAPGIRGDDPNGFYGSYCRDLDGNKLCFFRNGPA